MAFYFGEQAMIAIFHITFIMVDFLLDSIVMSRVIVNMVSIHKSDIRMIRLRRESPAVDLNK